MIYTVFGADNLYLTDALVVTPNYISFLSNTTVTINRKNSTHTLATVEGECKVVDREVQIF